MRYLPSPVPLHCLHTSAKSPICCVCVVRWACNVQYTELVKKELTFSLKGRL